ncbi:ras-related and estrogen-regulated growth inhibitor-like [Diadema setosum]|uniref:ras-related and estrogen-regulated growth inhibitor-like n=1 Tax=Diadema setosum TaxID=31175 RepID=UPI003B3B0253
MPENTAKMSSPPPTSNAKSVDIGSLKRKTSLSSITARRNGVVQSSKPLRVIVLGQASVGKTAFTVRFVTRRFIWEYDPTLEMIYRHRAFFPEETAPVDFEILDTAGQEDKTEEKMRWADAFIIVYSIADRCSFDEVMRLKFLCARATSKRSHDPAILIVGNKRDLEYDRIVETDEGEELARSLGCAFLEVSVRESFEEVYNAFEKLMSEYRVRKRTSSTTQKFSLRKKNSVPKMDLDNCPPRPRERSTSFVTPMGLMNRKFDHAVMSDLSDNEIAE